MSDDGSRATASRVECHRCARPSSLCLCSVIPRVACRTRLTVLQHPRERLHPIGTARFVELGLGARVISPVHADRSLACADDVPEGAALLFPGDGARDLATLSPDERPRHLVVLDGTWSQARSLHRANPWLARLPQVRLAPRMPSRYRIRREPRGDYVSTVEAVVEALRALEPELEGLDPLLAAFDRMIDAQIESAERAGRSPRRRAGTRRSARRIPRALQEDYDDLVLVYAEWDTPPCARATEGRRALQWAALRPATGERFERMLVPCDAGATRFARELGIAPDGTATEADALAALRAFAGPRALFAAWDRAPLLRLAEGGVDGGRVLSLRDAYRTCRGPTRGSLDDVLAREGVEPRALPFGGRAGARVANAAALVALLRDHGRRVRALVGALEPPAGTIGRTEEIE